MFIPALQCCMWTPQACTCTHTHVHTHTHTHTCAHLLAMQSKLVWCCGHPDSQQCHDRTCALVVSKCAGSLREKEIKVVTGVLTHACVHIHTNNSIHNAMHAVTHACAHIHTNNSIHNAMHAVTHACAHIHTNNSIHNAMHAVVSGRRGYLVCNGEVCSVVS